MRDPYIHAEKTPLPGFGHVAMRDLLLSATGLAGDMPKTVATGCGKRRPFAMTSMVPERVTCLACREYARAQYTQQAENADMLISIPDSDPIWETAKVTRESLAAEARKDRAMAARYA